MSEYHVLIPKALLAETIALLKEAALCRKRRSLMTGV